MPARKLINSGELYRVVFNGISEAVSIIDEDYGILDANRAFREEFCLGAADVVGRKCHEVTHQRSTPCEGPDETCPLRETLASGRPASAEHVHYGSDGKVVHVEVSTSPIKDEKGEIACVVHISRDITGRKQVEERLRASLEDKEMLLKEIHHRVKNNLQVISSLLNLQTSQVEDEGSLKVFRDSQSRIKAMAVMHEQFYLSGDIAKVDFEGYAKSLIKELVRFYCIPPGISMSVRIRGVAFCMDTAIPCGLIINELLSNALKHAFPGRDRGNVEISLSPVGGGEFELVVSDDGVGLPRGLDFRQPETLGFRLVRALAEGQLEGSVEVSSSRGTEARVRFKEHNCRKTH